MINRMFSLKVWLFFSLCCPVLYNVVDLFICTYKKKKNIKRLSFVFF